MPTDPHLESTVLEKLLAGKADERGVCNFISGLQGFQLCCLRGAPPISRKAAVLPAMLTRSYAKSCSLLRFFQVWIQKELKKRVFLKTS